MNKIEFYGDLRKVDAEQRIVSGYASTEAVDSAGEIVLKSAVAAALDDYLEWGNVREMHQPSAVGTAVEARLDDKGLYLCAKIVDDAAWRKVVEKVYRGFSIGGKVRERDTKNRNVITKLSLAEISLVDRPCNTEARFDLWKAAGSPTLESTFDELPAEDKALVAIKAARKFDVKSKWGF
jgi:HK97 family phage prohead protease